MVTKIGIVDRRRIVISGKVQGIAFRVWLKSVAESLDVAGSVCNLPDGRCEVFVQGERSLVKQFVVACKRGPSPQTVERAEIFEEPLEAKSAGFVVAR